MLGLERRETIMEILHEKNKVYVSELAKQFQVTEETIRRDLEKLEGEGLLKRSYGGAMLIKSTSEDLSFSKRSSINNESKLAIAAKAEELINDGDTVMVDSSTTCRALLLRLKGKKKITIITNSIRITSDFIGSGFDVICTGGNLRSSSGSLTGTLACNALKNYYADFALISCKGLDPAKGLMESNDNEADVKRTMMAQSRQVILLADHSKFNKTAFVRCGSFDELSFLVTDQKLSPDWQKFLSDHQIQLID